ncbi:MAG: peptidylprolyl isomerase [Methanoregula sp.]|nr:peptidylprolyl isomerase [Methanoregula sp.]
MSGPSKKKKKTEKEKAEGKTGGLTRKNQMIIGGVIALVVIFIIVVFIFPNPVVAAPGDSVSVYYTLRLEDGTLFDSNINRTPLAFTVGSAGIIPGFSSAIVGMKVNQEKTVDIPFDQAYGPYREDLIRVVNRTGIFANQTLSAGQYYTLHSTTDNTASTIRILNVTPTTVTIDTNAPLAGQNLTFTVQLVSLKKGTGGTGAGTSPSWPVPTNTL